MIGAVRVKVKNSRNNYDFTLRRNITILCGDSGRGKTTLYEMIREFNRFGKEESGVSISCDKSVIALSGNEWEDKLSKISNSIIVIDEDSRFISSKDFADAVKNSSNYFLIITRKYLTQLPYSVDEILKIEGGKNKKFLPVYNAYDRFYDDPNSKVFPFKPEIIITEDSNSGYQYFSEIAEKLQIKCVSARGKSNIYSCVSKYDGKDVLVIADGAAIGSEVAKLVEEQKLSRGRVVIFLPESFEWLILISGVVISSDADELTHTENYVDSSKYMSWEQYFTELLMSITQNDRKMAYRKDKLAEFYKKGKVRDKILSQIKHLDCKEMLNVTDEQIAMARSKKD